MIQLNAVPPPPELTARVVEKLTAKFKSDGSSVWKKKYIKKALLKMSNSKCAYSEIKLREEGKYMEVEHFLPKSAYPDKVMEWDNLLPASKFCNGKKLTKDSDKFLLIHPVRDVPKDHLYMVDYIIHGRTPKGKSSVIILGLNDPDHLLTPRREIRFAIQTELCKQYYQVKDFQQNQDSTKELEVVYALENLMKQGGRKEEYSATVATAILNDPHYIEIKVIFESYNLWSSDLQDLEDELRFCALDTKP